jgi:hypothetical protein
MAGAYLEYSNIIVRDKLMLHEQHQRAGNGLARGNRGQRLFKTICEYAALLTEQWQTRTGRGTGNIQALDRHIPMLGTSILKDKGLCGSIGIRWKWLVAFWGR